MFTPEEVQAAKKELLDCLKGFDNKEETVSETLFNVYPTEMNAIVRLLSRKQSETQEKQKTIDQNKLQLIEDYIEFHYGQTADDGLKSKLRNAASVGWELCLNSNKVMPKLNSTKLIGDVQEHFKNLSEHEFDWKSFYNGWIEGRTQLVFGGG